MEIIQAVPLEIQIGFSSARIWVNNVVTSRAYFGNFSTGDTAIADGNSAALDVCGAYDATSANLVSSKLTGTFDIMNFLWISGSEGAFQNLSGKIILFFGGFITFLKIQAATGEHSLILVRLPV
jgi:hypothetical protein